MIDLARKFDILHKHFVEGKGIREIARDLHISKNTVRSYVNEFAEQKEDIINGADKSQILLAMNDEPRYDSSSRMRTVVTDEIIEQIKGYLGENDKKRALGKSKLCMKATDIYEELVAKGYKISYPSVVRYVRELADKKNEAYIKQEYNLGDICEFDWGEAPLTIGDTLIKYRLAVFTLAATNYRYALLYRHEDMQAFVDAHIKFIANIEGVPHTMVYDNMRVAIAQFVGKNEKVATAALKQMSTYYGFGYRFCNIHSGNEKGHVERSVEYVRRKAFATINTFDDEGGAHERLRAVINRLNSDKETALSDERAAMLPKMPDYSSAIRKSAIVDKYSTIVFKQNHYSVPDYLVGKTVNTFVFTDEIAVVYKGKEVGRHKRSFGSCTYTMDIMHYRETLKKKPGAVKGSACLKQSNETLQALYNTHFSECPKEFIQVLGLLSEYSLEQIMKAIETLAGTGAKIQMDSIKMILVNKPAVSAPAGNDDIEKACELYLSRYQNEVAI